MLGSGIQAEHRSEFISGCFSASALFVVVVAAAFVVGFAVADVDILIVDGVAVGSVAVVVVALVMYFVSVILRVFVVAVVGGGVGGSDVVMFVVVAMIVVLSC